MSLKQILQNGATQFNLSLNDAQLIAFDRYCQELIAWNQRLNLTRIVDPDEIALKHFLDSLSVAPLLPLGSGSLALIDVGSGAGFPGLPLKIALPQLRLTLLEATGKKTRFLRQLLDLLQLKDVTVLTARAEEAGRLPAHRQQYDVAVARAVAALPVLAEYTLPLVKVGGLVIAQKGQSPQAEVKAAANAVGILGGKVDEIVPVAVPGLDAARHLLVIRKVKPTPPQYPRRPGMPAQKPIR